MNISNNGLELIKQFEGYKDKAYKDSGGIWTIGVGTIRYPDGRKVCENDCCTEQEAQGWLLNHLEGTIAAFNKLPLKLNQNQMDACISLIYNIGLGAFKKSTLYKKALINPGDETIYKYDKEKPADSCEFTKWCKVNKVVVKGLLTRRMKEADLYSNHLF